MSEGEDEAAHSGEERSSDEANTEWDRCGRESARSDDSEDSYHSDGEPARYKSREERRTKSQRLSWRLDVAKEKQTESRRLTFAQP